MKLFFKHLFRSIKKRPLQPLVIIFTIALSVLVSISALTIKNSIDDEMDSANKAIYGSSDIALQLNSNSKSRFMFDTEVEKILEGKANAVGIYELVFSLNGENIFARAVDFYEVDTVFDFEFTQYGELKEEKIEVSAMITEELAKKHSLSLGDKLELTLFGKNISYTVCAISKTPFFDSYNVIVDIRGVMKALASESLFISALDDIKPYSTIFIDVINDNDKAECIALLVESNMFSDKTIVEVSERINEGLTQVSLPLIINLCIILCCFLTSVVVFNCIYILSKQRTEENNTFIVAGTKTSKLNLLQYMEVILYWLIGVPIGVALTYPCFLVIENYLSFKYASYTLSASSVLISSLLIFVVSILTVTLFILTRGERRHKEQKGKITIVLLAALLISLLIVMLVKGQARLILGIISVLLTLGVVFFTTPYLISRLLSLIFLLVEKRRKKGKKIKNMSLYYALKNFSKIDVLKNTARLLSSLGIVILSVAALVGASHGNLKATREFFDGDYIVLNATERCYNEIAVSEHLDQISYVYQSRATYDNGHVTFIVSTSNKEVFGKNIEINELPKGNEAIISTTDAKMLGVDVGDEFLLKIDGKDTILKVKEIAKTGTVSVIFDSEYFGVAPNMLLVKAVNGEKENLLADLTVASASELSTIISADELRNDKIEPNLSLLKCANLLLYAVVMYALIGIINNLYESYRARKEELSLYSYAGISKSKISRMIAYEILSMLFIGLIIGIIGAIIVILSMNKAFYQLNFEVILYFRYLFK